MNHTALASLRRSGPSASVGFTLSEDPQTNLILHVAGTAAVVGLGSYAYMSRCKSKMAESFDESAAEYDEKASHGGELGTFYNGLAQGFTRAAIRLRK